MDNAIVNFNMGDLKKRITEQVQANFGMLIPPDKFAEMVNTEVAAFFEVSDLTLFSRTERKEGSDWNRATYTEDWKIKATPFRVLIWLEVNKLISESLKAHFASEAFKVHIPYSYDQNQSTQLSDEMEARLVKMVPTFMAELMRNTFGSMVLRAKEEILQSIRPH